jgi:hypothetical protein
MFENMLRGWSNFINPNSRLLLDTLWQEKPTWKMIFLVVCDPSMKSCE